MAKFMIDCARKEEEELVAAVYGRTKGLVGVT